MLLGKASKEIQKNYNSLWNSIMQHRNFMNRSADSESDVEFSRRSSPIANIPDIQDPSPKKVFTHQNIRNDTQTSMNTESIRKEIFLNTYKSQRKRKYSLTLLKFCSALFIISVSSYILFAKVFRLSIGEMKRNISYIPNLIRDYRDRQMMKKMSLCLLFLLLMPSILRRKYLLKKMAKLKVFKNPSTRNNTKLSLNSLEISKSFWAITGI